MAKLLDVPNNHKPIYHEKAAQSPPSFILSALNVVNESVLEYKNAHNRRLHTELCLIRLCYLLQATKIDFSGEKKNNSPSIATQTAQPNTLTAQPQSTAAPIYTSTIVEQQIVKEETTPEPQPVAPTQNISSEKSAPFAASENAAGATRRISRNMLQATNNIADTEKMAMSDLTLEMVEHIFAQYKQQLKAENKSILFNAFETIKLEMPESGLLQLISPNKITDSYAQSERGNIQDLIKKETGLLVSISNIAVIEENEPGERALSKAEVFALMAEKNPMLHQLKDALKMSIDY